MQCADHLPLCSLHYLLGGRRYTRDAVFTVPRRDGRKIMTSPLVPIRIKTCGSNLIDAAEHYPFLGILTGYRDPVLRGFADQTTTTTTTATPPTTPPHFPRALRQHITHPHFHTSTPRCFEQSTARRLTSHAQKVPSEHERPRSPRR